jgi:hypothetical protein
MNFCKFGLAKIHAAFKIMPENQRFFLEHSRAG